MTMTRDRPGMVRRFASAAAGAAAVLAGLEFAMPPAVKPSAMLARPVPAVPDIHAARAQALVAAALCGDRAFPLIPGASRAAPMPLAWVPDPAPSAVCR